MMVMEFLGIVHVARRVKEWGRNDKTVSTVWEAEARRGKTLSVMELHQGQDLLGAAHKIWKTSSPNL